MNGPTLVVTSGDLDIVKNKLRSGDRAFAIKETDPPILVAQKICECLKVFQIKTIIVFTRKNALSNLIAETFIEHLKKLAKGSEEEQDKKYFVLLCERYYAVSFSNKGVNSIKGPACLDVSEVLGYDYKPEPSSEFEDAFIGMAS